jgi:hypothetical protein
MVCVHATYTTRNVLVGVVVTFCAIIACCIYHDDNTCVLALSSSIYAHQLHYSSIYLQYFTASKGQLLASCSGLMLHSSMLRGNRRSHEALTAPNQTIKDLYAVKA